MSNTKNEHPTKVLTAKSIQQMQGVSLTTAKRVAATIRKHTGSKTLYQKHYDEYYFNI